MPASFGSDPLPTLAICVGRGLRRFDHRRMWQVGFALGEGDRQLRAGVHVSKNKVRQRFGSCGTARKPRFQNRADLSRPKASCTAESRSQPRRWCADLPPPPLRSVHPDGEEATGSPSPCPRFPIGRRRRRPRRMHGRLHWPPCRGSSLDPHQNRTEPWPPEPSPESISEAKSETTFLRANASGPCPEA